MTAAFAIGDSVFHRQYARGVVRAVDGLSVHVDFAVCGPKKVLASFLGREADADGAVANENRTGLRIESGPRITAAPTIAATPFQWIDPATIPRRRWIYGRHLIRKFISETVSHGGLGKSSLLLAETLAIATDRDLLGVSPDESVPVWYWNGEDPTDELQRRIMAAALHYGIDRTEFEGRLFVDTGRETKIVIADQTKAGTVIRRPIVDALKRVILEHDIGLLIIDPFVSCHTVPENDTAAVQAVATEWAEIADVTNCAIELVHHSRKTNGAEVTVEDGRGAVALLAKARSARTLNGMSEEEAAKYGVENRRLHFRVGNGKANLHIPSDKADWYRLASVDLGNGPMAGLGGDSIGVVTRWKIPNPLEGVTTADLRAAQNAVAAGGPWRENSQASDWVGIPIATAMRLDPANKADKTKVKANLAIWTSNGMFEVYEDQDASRRMRKFVKVGALAND